jgi:peptidyl-dipeptidase A
MFGAADYRIMMCASVTDADLQVMIHEIGHIHYFMAYKDLPTIFQVKVKNTTTGAV